MISRQEILADHLPYELCMLKHSFARMCMYSTSKDQQLDYNAHYESFVTHARNLYGFFTNDNDPPARAGGYVKNFKADKTDETKPAFQKLT